MEKAKDFYAILGVPKDVAKKELTKAYRVLVKKYHPDHNPDDPTAQAKFRDVQSAYDVLSDPEKRQIYDEFGIDPLDPQAFAAAKQAKAAGMNGDAFRRGFGGGSGGGSGGGYRGGPGGFQFDSNGGGFDFSQLFGGMGGGNGGAEGFDFSQLFGGMDAVGGGGRRGTRRRNSLAKGRDLEHDLTIPFRTSIQGGSVSLRIARSENAAPETLDVKIPAGIEDGKKIRLRGQGEPASAGGVAGDLLLRIHVASDSHFRREGNHVIVRVPVTYAEATLGGKVDVPSPQGIVTVTVPAGTTSGKRLRIRGQGVATKSGPGDLLVEISVDVPKTVDEETANLIRTLDQKTASATREQRGKLHW